MRTSLKWIKDLVPGIADVTPQEYLDAMTLSGSKGEYFVEVLIGQVGDVLLIASGGDIGKGEVNDVAELLLCSSELCGVPKGGGVVGKVD